MKTNFEKVIEFNKCFGSYVSSTLNHELFKTSPKIVELKFSLVEEEVNELADFVGVIRLLLLDLLQFPLLLLQIHQQVELLL